MKPITLHTDFDAWAAWLTAYLRGHQKTVIEGGDAYLQPFPNIAAQTSAQWSVTARVRAMLAEDADFPPNGEALVFDVIRLDAARLQITPHCYTEAWLPYLENLLRSMADTWPATEDAAQPAQAERSEDTAKKPRVPGRQADLNKWRACWRKIKPEWRRGKAYFEIREWLDAQDTRLAYSEDVLAEIIAAGEAGLLDAD